MTDESGQKLTPWARCYRAHLRGTGLRLTPEEVAEIAMDGAFMTRGELDYEAAKSGRDPYSEELDSDD